MGHMASGIAHDFNNALSPVLGFSELLLNMPTTLDDKEKLERYLKMMHTAAQDATNVVKCLSEFYRHRTQGEDFRPINLSKLIEQVMSLTQPRWKDQAQANGKPIHMVTDLQEIPSITGNESELREVLTNLIFNAVDAISKGGKITLRSRLLGEQVLIEVDDTGRGMTEEIRQRCFDPFFSTKLERGMGLGLSMVFGIIQRHQGKITVASTMGVGTAFTIRLPVLSEQLIEDSRERAKAVRPPLHVLVVEDESPVCEMIAAYLITQKRQVMRWNPV